MIEEMRSGSLNRNQWNLKLIQWHNVS